MSPADSAPPQPSLSHHRGLLWLWSGQGVSVLGAQFSMLAIPVLAVTVLHAEAWQMGLLNAAETAAFLVVGLPAGAWVDRWLKRRTMIVADVVRAAMLAVIPVFWMLGVLQIWQLYVVGAVVGVATVFFDVSYQSYIPILVPVEQIGPANARLEATSQVAHIPGPGLAGGLLAIVSAPVLLLADAVSYVFSAVFLSRIRDSEVAADPAERQSLGREIAEGVRFVASQPLIRRIVGTTANANLFSTMTFTLFPLFVLRDLGLTAPALGIMFSFGSAGGLIGAIVTPRLAKRVGEGTLIPLSALAGGAMMVLIPIAAYLPAAGAIPVLSVAQFGLSFAVLVYNITQVTLRQRLCPPRLLGRMNAPIRFVIWGVMPISSLIAGWPGGVIGIIPTMWIAFAGTLAGSAFVLFSPLTGMRVLPTELEAHPIAP